VWLCAEGRQEFINHLQMVIELHNLADLHFQRGSRAFSAALYWHPLLAEAVGEEVEGIDKVQEEDEVEDEDEDEEDGEDSDEMEQGTKKLRNEQKLETCPKCDTPLIENEIALSAHAHEGGDPVAREMVIGDASDQVRCTICSEVCVHVPCPVPGFTLMDSELFGQRLSSAA